MKKCFDIKKCKKYIVPKSLIMDTILEEYRLFRPKLLFWTIFMKKGIIRASINIPDIVSFLKIVKKYAKKCIYMQSKFYSFWTPPLNLGKE